MAALKATSTTICVCRHIVKTSFIFAPPWTRLRYLLNPSSPPYPATRSLMHPARSTTKPTIISESLGLQRHRKDVGGPDGRDEDRHQERQVLPDPLDDVPGFEIQSP